MSHPPTVTLQHLESGVTQVMLNRPAQMNAINPDMFRELAAMGQQLSQSIKDGQDIRAVVLGGEGRAFCSGLDMASFAAIAQQAGGQGAGASAAGDDLPPGMHDLATRRYGVSNLFQYVAMAWRELPVPVIAAVQGVAYGGGLQIALGADIRLITAQTRMSVMEIRWGLIPDMGGMALLRQLVRGDVARELTYTGRVVEGQEAVNLGLATRVTEDPLAAALSLAREMAERSPSAVRAAKRLLNQMDDGTTADLLLAESAEQASLLGSPDQVEAVAANLEKRPPRWHRT